MNRSMNDVLNTFVHSIDAASRWILDMDSAMTRTVLWEAREQHSGSLPSIEVQQHRKINADAQFFR